MSQSHRPPLSSSVPRLDTSNLDPRPDIKTYASSTRVAEVLPTEGPKKKFTRRHGLGPKWHKDYSQIDQCHGRVLVIEFAKQDASKTTFRKVTAQEVYDLPGLRKVYANSDRNDEAILRVFHVQNADWATRWLLRKFNIDNRDNLVGTDFGKYVRHKRPERRGGRPLLSGKTWKVQYDPWRGISKASFGMDYLKQYKLPIVRANNASDEEEDLKMMEMNCYNEDDLPTHGFDVYVQRLSCYVQHKQEISVVDLPIDSDIKNPYIVDGAQADGSSPVRHKDEYIPRLDTLDNGNAILIFDNSNSGRLDDTLIPPRQTLEERWRRLPFFLAFESRDLVVSDEQLAFQSTRAIVEDVFKALATNWGTFLDQATDHITILEDKIYEQPADETRAPELWLNSSLWLKVEKLIFIHIDVVKELIVRLADLTDDVESDDTWLDSVPSDFERISNLITEDLIKPTETLISLLYQSVSIRDSRHSIELGISMWRLSWITFIFLPLTFITGFFGMNVDTFKSNPKIQWYFISVVPFMFSVLVVWYFIKHYLASQRQTPQRRGIYENFFSDMADTHPALWSRRGPRGYIVPKGRVARIKWWCIKRWSAPHKTIQPIDDNSGSNLGVVSKVKRHFIRRWTSQIKTADRPVVPTEATLEQGDQNVGDTHNVLAEGLQDATELLVIPATPAAEPLFEEHGGLYHGAALAEGRLVSPPTHRPGSSDGKSSSLLVEEEDWQWLSERGKRGKQFSWRTSSSRERSMEKQKKQGASQDESKRAEVPEVKVSQEASKDEPEEANKET
ncbi:hypothetical protein FQN57_005651 [Myotisia sp. PD_48]|nr:hypothetical protein FQN57_005651 [Myotisia sp. PD_48]